MRWIALFVVACCARAQGINYIGSWAYQGETPEGLRVWTWEVMLDAPLELDWATAHWTCSKTVSGPEVQIDFPAWPWQDQAWIADGGANWNALAHGYGEIMLWPGKHTLVKITTPATMSYASVLANRGNDIDTTVGVSDPLNDGTMLPCYGTQRELGVFLAHGFATLVQYAYEPSIDYDQNGWVNLVDLGYLLSVWSE